MTGLWVWAWLVACWLRAHAVTVFYVVALVAVLVGAGVLGLGDAAAVAPCVPSP